MNVQPVGRRIRVKPHTPDQRIGSIHLAAPISGPTSGVVEAVGELCTWIRRGDTVVFPEFAGTRMTVDGEAYTIMSETEVYGCVHAD